MENLFHLAPSALLLLLLSSPLGAQEDADLMSELKACRGLSDIEERLACYDKIGKKEPAAEAVPVEPQAPEVQSATTEESFGLPKTEEQLTSIQAKVVRCGYSNNRRFYFYLDNGQAWKYLGSKRLRYKNCDSAATLSEDRIGFKLRMTGEPAFRVQRVR